jgi:protein TonB
VTRQTVQRLLRQRTLQLAFGLSLIVHLALAFTRLQVAERIDRVFQDAPLEVILVNTRVQEDKAPEKAQALAQTQLAGGGELKAGRAASPLISANETTQGETTQMLQQQVATMRKEQSLLLAQVKQMMAALPTPQPEKGHVANEAIEQKRRQLLKLLAEIELRIEQDNVRPRKHYISPATREVAYAQYYDGMRRKIEERGTRSFPERMGQKLYGELTMIITINADGRVLNTEVVQASGNSELDRRAQAIAVSAGPFGDFSKEMRKQADQLAIISRFIFSRDNALRTQGEAAN